MSAVREAVMSACADSMYAAIAHATRDRPRPIVNGVR